MRRLGLLFFFILTPTFAANLVYKAEQADGIVILSDSPIKNVDHQEIIRLQPETHAANNFTIPKIQANTTTPVDKKTLENKIALAKLDVEKANTQLIQARLQQLKTKHECQIQEYRSGESEKNSTACQGNANNSAEVDLARARAHVAQLQSQFDNLA